MLDMLTPAGSAGVSCEACFSIISPLVSVSLKEKLSPNLHLTCRKKCKYDTGYMLKTSEPKDHRLAEVTAWRCLRQGASNSSLGRKGWGQGFMRNFLFFLAAMSVPGTPSGHLGPFSGEGDHGGAALTGKWLARNFQSCCPNCLTRVLSCSSWQCQKDRGLSSHRCGKQLFVAEPSQEEEPLSIHSVMT